MFEKHNRFYADWRDRKGARHRKAFLTAGEAGAFEAVQKEKARPGKEKARDEQSRTAPFKRSQTGAQIIEGSRIQPSITQHAHSSRRLATRQSRGSRKEK